MEYEVGDQVRIRSAHGGEQIVEVVQIRDGGFVAEEFYGTQIIEVDDQDVLDVLSSNERFENVGVDDRMFGRPSQQM